MHQVFFISLTTLHLISAPGNYIYLYTTSTPFKLKILPLHVYIRNSVVRSLETRNGTGLRRKEDNIQSQSSQHKGGGGVSSQAWETLLFYSYARWFLALSIRSMCQFKKLWSWTWTEREVEPKELAANFCFLGLQFCNLKRIICFPHLNFPLADRRAGLYHHSLLRHCLAPFPSIHDDLVNPGLNCCCPYRVCVASRAQYGSIRLHRGQVSQQRKRTCVCPHPSMFQFWCIAGRGHWCFIKRETE